MSDSGSARRSRGVRDHGDFVFSMNGIVPSIFASLSAGLVMVQAGVPSDAPSESKVVEMAQHLVQEQFMFGSLGHYHIEFDVAYLHPQPEPDYWAVVGGFVSDQNTPNTYVAAVRLVCPEFDEVACWQLEKLAINDAIVLDRGKPL
jgi:hypothetical protein